MFSNMFNWWKIQIDTARQGGETFWKADNNNKKASYLLLHSPRRQQSTLAIK